MTTTEHADQPAEAPTDDETGAGLPEDVAPVRSPHLLLHRVGCGRRPHHADGGGLQAHLRDEHLPGVAGAVGVLRRVLPAGDPRGAHQRAVRLQGRAALRCAARCGRRDRLLPGEQDHDLRSVPGRPVRDRRGLLDPRDVRQPVRVVAGAGGDRDTKTELRSGLQSCRHEHRCAACRDADTAEVGRAGEHGQRDSGPGACRPRWPVGRSDGSVSRPRLRPDRDRTGDRDQEIAADRRGVPRRRHGGPEPAEDPDVEQALRVRGGRAVLQCRGAGVYVDITSSSTRSRRWADRSSWAAICCR